MLKDKINFNSIKEGYLVVPIFLSKDKLGELKKSIIEKELKKEMFNVFEQKSLWNIITNKELIEILKNFIGDKVYFLYSASFLNDIKANKYSWHRDNPCRQTGVGPDWDDDLNYNVVSAVLYLNNSDETKTGLSLIPLNFIEISS